MNKEKNVKKAFIWNMIGSTCYSASSFFYLLIVTRLCGVYEAGFFSLSYATAQLLLAVGRFGMRTFQATDLEEKYSFSVYAVSRVITCSLMMIFGLAYSAYSFDGKYIVISFFVIGMKMIDAVEDVYHGNLQQKYNVELMGKMLAIRNVYSAVCFTVILYLTRNLMITCVVTVLTSLAICFVINSFARRIACKSIAGKRDEKFDMAGLKALMLKCAPLFGGTFLSLLLFNIPKYAMSNIMTDEYQTYYSILFMPSFVITLMCEFVFKPTITSIATLWWEEKIKQFNNYVLRIILIISGMCAFIVLAGHLIGRRLLEIIYGVDLSAYKLHFIILLIGGGIGACVYMIYNILIAIRKGQCILVVYGITTIVTALPARLMVRKWGILGASLNYLYSCSVLFIIFAAILITVIVRKMNKCS